MIHPVMVDKIEIWSLDRLVPDARNARTHSNKQIAQLAGSIQQFGFMTPVLVDSEGKIIAGHGRVLAARKLRLGRVPVVIAEHLTEAQKRAYAIADNQIALNAEWDEELLKIELNNLRDEEVNLDALGFGAEEFDRLMKELDPGEPGQSRSDQPGTDGPTRKPLLATAQSPQDAQPEEIEPVLAPDPRPNPPEPLVSKPGVTWALGDSALFCGQEDPENCDRMIRYWQEITGKDAYLAGAGETFAEIAARITISSHTNRGTDDAR
jgi:ParB-like nuclease family protein